MPSNETLLNLLQSKTQVDCDTLDVKGSSCLDLQVLHNLAK